MAAQDAPARKRFTSAASVDREAIDLNQARELMRLFKIFASETRLRLLDALICRGELCVSELCGAVGMKPQAVSNQLQRLVDHGMLASRREGNNVYYRIVDPCVEVLIERGLCLIRCPDKSS
ncbi:MAG TPA: transcriptional regulator, partial [Planctomycetaceae bacterium]|nr:transcriptional regulator [Planctomycetaceae bacterium]